MYLKVNTKFPNAVTILPSECGMKYEEREWQKIATANTSAFKFSNSKEIDEKIVG